MEDLVDGVGARSGDGLDVFGVGAEAGDDLIEVDQSGHRHVDVFRLGVLA
ncbi:MAG: hypothetical protein ACXV3B_01220 [Ilumatobacteraceae bacterium]